MEGNNCDLCQGTESFFYPFLSTADYSYARTSHGSCHAEGNDKGDTLYCTCSYIQGPPKFKARVQLIHCNIYFNVSSYLISLRIEQYF
jgi:hypothetical protein